MNERAAFRDRLVDEGYLISTGVPGVYGRTGAFESIVAGIEQLLRATTRHDGGEALFFPPVLDRTILERTGYLENFPDLCGSVHCFRGNDRDHVAYLGAVRDGHDWTPFLQPSAVALCPSACYPLYPTIASPLPAGGRIVDLSSHVFRCEPSDDPSRMQAFRMLEQVFLGAPEDALTWRTRWIERAKQIRERLALPGELAAANDPFFGRGGRLMKQGQLDGELKFELQVPVFGEGPPVAVASFNYHREHYTHTFSITRHDGGEAHTACIGFGLERMTLALLSTHGLTPATWPQSVRRELCL